MLDNDLENKWPNLIDIKRTITIPDNDSYKIQLG